LLRRLRRDESGSMLIELLIAMTFLSLAVGALLTVYTSSVLSLRHSSIQGNALTLVDQQMETLKSVPFASIALDGSTIPSRSDVYVTSSPEILTSSQRSSIAGGQITGGTISASRTVVGPDNRTYRVDTYMFSQTPSGGRPVIQVTIAARLVKDGAVGGIKAQSSSAFDESSTESL